MTISFLFRKPKFPIICNFNGIVMAAKSLKSLEKKLKKIPIDTEKYYDIVDVTNEGWGFSAKHMVISPLTIKKKWFKREVIDLYNKRKNSSKQGKEYSIKSISSKRFDKIFTEIVDLLEK